MASIVLVDVKNSTNLLEKIGAEVWVDLMNRLFQLLEVEIYRFGGRITQFLGDGFLAFFGTVTAHEDDPERAILAGLRMQQAVQRAAVEAPEYADITLRMGINTGEVIVTSVGDSRLFQENTAMGEAVSLAARLEKAAEPGTVLVSENTFRLVEAQFNWQPLGELDAKGFSKPVSVYRPLSHVTGIGGLHHLKSTGITTPLTGRDHEYELLKNAVASLQNGRGGVVMVTGDTGMGKLFLVAQVHEHFTRQQALRTDAQAREIQALPMAPVGFSNSPAFWLQARCRSYEQSSPFAFWHELILNNLGVEAGDTPEIRISRLRAQAEDLWGERYSSFYPYLARFLELPLEEEFTGQVKFLDAQALQSQTFLSVRSWLEALSKRGPLAVEVDGVEWAGISALELLKYCLPLAERETLLWVLVFRQDRASPVWDFRHFVETEFPHCLSDLSLKPLTEAESSAYLDHMLGSPTVSEETRKLLIQKAEGNPYYLQELVNALVAQQALVQEASTGQWREVRTVTSLDLPRSLHSLMLARLDRLAGETRRLLQAASVIGATFWELVLQAIAVGDGVLPEDFRDQLLVLQRARLVEEHPLTISLGRELGFTSSLLRDTAYDSLLKAQRVAYHLKTAEYLASQIQGSNPEQYYNLIASHYRLAGQSSLELAFTVKAAEHAREIFANAEAVLSYQRAISLVEALIADHQVEVTHDMLAQLYQKLGEVMALMGRYSDARLAYQRALDQPYEQDPLWQSSVYRLVHLTHSSQFHYQEAHAALDLAEKALDFHPDQPSAQDAEGQLEKIRNEWLEIQFARGTLLYWQNRWPSIDELLGILTPLIEADKDIPHKVRLLDLMLLSNLRRERYRLSEKTIELARNRFGLDQIQSDLTLNPVFMVGFVLLWGDQIQEALGMLQKALSLAEKTGAKTLQARCLSYLAVSYRKLGNLEEVLQYSRRALDISTEIGESSYLSIGHANLAWLAFRKGDYDQVINEGDMVFDIWKKTPAITVFHHLALWPLLAVAVERRQIARAVDLAGQLLLPEDRALPPQIEADLKAGLQAAEREDEVSAWDYYSQALAGAVQSREL